MQRTATPLTSVRIRVVSPEQTLHGTLRLNTGRTSEVVENAMNSLRAFSYGGYSSVGRALGCGSRGREFKPH